MPTGIEREKDEKRNRYSRTDGKERDGEMQRDRTDGMGQMERGHASEVQPSGVTEEYTKGIAEKHILNNATVYRVSQMIRQGELTEKEGLYLMVNLLAEENAKTHEMCNELIMQMPSRLLVEMISGKN